MASYNIPESVIGVPLFVPDGHDFFEIVASSWGDFAPIRGISRSIRYLGMAAFLG